MNTIVSFLAQLAITFLIVFLVVRYIRPHLHKVLVDLCGTEERAQFWTTFSNVLLTGLPMILALNYRPDINSLEGSFFEMAGKLSGNLGGLLVAVMGIGVIVSFFALVAPRQPKAETK